MRKNKKYEILKRINKETYLNNFIEKYESFVGTMFTYEGLPDTLKGDYIEKILYYEGSGVFAKIPEGENIDGTRHKEGVYFFKPNYSGILNEFDEPTKQINISTYLNYNKTEDLSDCVKIKNNSSELATVTTVNKYAIYLYDNELSLNMNIVLSRVPYIISASDDNTRNSAIEFIQSIINGDYKIIGESEFFEGVKLNNTAQNSNTPTNYIETLQYYKASLLHELGVNANYNMKREALNGSEIDVNVDALKPIVIDMYRHRLKAVEDLNEKFGLSVSVVLNEPWNFGTSEDDDPTNDAENILNENEPEPEETEETEETDTEPEETETEPDETDTEPEETETEPDETETEPDETDTEPDETEPEPEGNESEPEPEPEETEENKEEKK